MTDPFHPSPEVHAGSAAHRLIRAVMRMESDLLLIERVVLYRADGWTVSMMDTGDGDAVPWSSGGDCSFHILWQANEEDAWIEADGERFTVAPGDTMSVPGGTRVRLAAGMLMILIESAGQALERVLPPDHGVESFEGYNRRTEYETPGTFSIQRWKITQPLTLPESNAPYAVIDLAAPLAITWAGGTDLISRGECRVIQAGSGPITLLPDGLGYALVVR